jgi:hypothetical protein
MLYLVRRKTRAIAITNEIRMEGSREETYSESLETSGVPMPYGKECVK